MKFTMEFEMDNAVFEEDLKGEMARIFIRVADWIQRIEDHDCEAHPVRDSDGNKIGAWRFEE